ncbi:MAG: hypothetical protein NZ516_00840 [Raineya sp.]|nr:hypothetical protein [Raineya sp.]
MASLQELALFLDTPLFLVPEYEDSISAMLKNPQAEMLFIFASEADAQIQNKQKKSVLSSMIEAVAQKQTNQPTIAELPKEILIFPEKKIIYWDFANTQIRYFFVFGENTAQNIGLQIEKYQWLTWRGVQTLVAHTLQEIESQKGYKNLIWQALMEVFQ